MGKVIELTKTRSTRQKEAEWVLDEFEGKKQEPIDFKAMQERKKGRQSTPYLFKDTEYTNIKAKVLNMKRGLKSLKNPTTLLFYLLQWKGYKDRRGRAGRWYKDGYIVASQSIEQMAVEFAVSESTIKRWIQALAEDKLIIIKKEGLYNVYVLGLIDRDGEEHFYYCGDIPAHDLP